MLLLFEPGPATLATCQALPDFVRVVTVPSASAIVTDVLEILVTVTPLSAEVSTPAKSIGYVLHRSGCLV